MSFFTHFFSKLKYRKLRVDILSIFLFLISISSIAIIWFTHAKHSKAIIDLSKSTIERVNATITEKIDCLLNNLQELPEITGGLVSYHKDLSAHNEELISYMLTALKFDKNLFAIYIGTPSGGFLEAINLGTEDLTHYRSDLVKPLPPGSVYAVRWVDRVQLATQEIWQFKNAQFETISQEEIPHSLYDPRTRVWYQGAERDKAQYWTDVYPYFSTGTPGITVAEPVYNSTNELIAVVGVDLSLTLFSEFLIKQPIGKTGKAFVLSTNGEIIAPTELIRRKYPASAITKELVSKAFFLSQKEYRKDFVFKNDSIEYIASAHPLDITSETEWLLLIIDPLPDFFSGVLQTQQQVTVISLGILLLAAILVVYFSKRISSPIVLLAKETDKIRHFDLDSKVHIHSNIKELRLMDSSISSLRTAIRSFARYMPKEVVKQLVQQKKELVIGGEKKEITILFSDITGFTSIAETLPTETTMTLLSEYFDLMSQIILSSAGTIDKYIGDGIMAFWGAPQEVSHHCVKASLAALECQTELKKLNQQRKEAELPEFHTRIGIHTGLVIVGNVGTSERMNYTVIGDAVNLAARLQPINKIYHTGIIISEEVYDKLGESFLVRPLDIVEVRGRKEKIRIYELVATLKEGSSLLATPEQIELCTEFAKAYRAFHQDSPSEAKALFIDLAKKFPEDIPTKTYLERLK